MRDEQEVRERLEDLRDREEAADIIRKTDYAQRAKELEYVLEER